MLFDSRCICVVFLVWFGLNCGLSKFGVVLVWFITVDFVWLVNSYYVVGCEFFCSAVMFDLVLWLCCFALVVLLCCWCLRTVA